MTQYTVGDLARMARVSNDTVRLYEKKGLLEKAERGENRYRYFTPDTLHRLRFIRRLQEMEFTLEEIALFLRLSHEGPLLCPSVKGLLEQKLAHLKDRVKTISSLASMLERFIEQCDNQEEGSHCPIIEESKATFQDPSIR